MLLFGIGFSRGESAAVGRSLYPAGGFMKPSKRANVVSSFTIIKGALISETELPFFKAGISIGRNAKT